METNDKEYALVKAKPRCKKMKPRIDLAAMVSVSFLLIIFFMVTKESARPQAMELGVSGGCDDCPRGCGLDFRRTITLLLDDNNKVIIYRGLLDLPEEAPKTLKFGKNGVRKILARAVEQIPGMTGDRNRGAIVIIKPSKNSNFGNLVDALDEMAINNVPIYAVVNDFTPEESKLLASN